MRRDLFRARALERLATPEQFNDVLEVSTPKGWISLLALVGVLVSGMVWAFAANITTTVSTEGVITRAGGLAVISAPTSGQVARLMVDAGSTVHAGDVIATIARGRSARLSLVPVISPFHGRIQSIGVTQGQSVASGARLLRAEPLDSRLELVAYLRPHRATAIRAGMSVRINPQGGVDPAAVWLHGRVTSVQSTPSAHEIRRMVGTPSLVRRFLRARPLDEIIIQLMPAGDRSPASNLPAGTLCTVRIDVGFRHPISLAVPGF